MKQSELQERLEELISQLDTCIDEVRAIHDDLLTLLQESGEEVKA